MIELKINWNELHIMSTFCYDHLFFNNINIENLIKAKNRGFILSTVSNIPILSLELPAFIRHRIPKNADFITYIKSNNGFLETDLLTIEVIEN